MVRPLGVKFYTESCTFLCFLASFGHYFFPVGEGGATLAPVGLYFIGGDRSSRDRRLWSFKSTCTGSCTESRAQLLSAHELNLHTLDQNCEFG